MNRIKQPWRLGLALLASVCLVSFPSYAQDDAAAANPATNTAAATESTTNAAATASNAAASDDGRIHRGDVVQIGSNAQVAADEDAGDVVAVMGSCKVLGNASGDVVAVFGDIEVNGAVEGNVVSVFGTVHLGPKARVRGDAISVGQEVDRAAGARVHGHVQQSQVSLPGFGNTRWLTDWFEQCIWRMRPLSFRVGWVWGVAGVFFLLYALIELAFPHSVRASVDALRERPMTTLAVGVLGNFGLAIIYLLLTVTLVGLLVIPLVQVAVIVALLVGKVAMMELIGGGIGRTTGSGALQRPFVAFLIGAVIVALLYTIPILGLLFFLFISAWGFGAATTAAFIRFRRERPPKSPPGPARPAPKPTPTPSPAFTMPVATAMTGAASAGAASAFAPTTPQTAPGNLSPAASSPTPAAAPLTTGFPTGPAFGAATAMTSEASPTSPNPVDAAASSPTMPTAPPPSASTPPPPPPPFSSPPSMDAPIAAAMAVPGALAYPRAGFWIRMAAGFLDFILLVIVGHFHFLLFCFCCVAYFTGLIGWKGTTVGGIILRLQVVRADGQPLTFLVAFVRALAGMFAALVGFLGFFWIAWDPEKQGWHDKIAGTVVVRLPHSPALLML